MSTSLAALLSLTVIDLPVALALGALVLSFAISVVGLAQVAMESKRNSLKGHSHE